MLSFSKKSYNFFSKAKCCSKFILRRLKANMTKNPAGIKEKYNDRRHIPQTRTIPKIKREKIAENKDKKTILCHFISPSVIANSNFRGKIYSPTVAIATGDAGFLHRNGQLSANRLQKKFDNPKMAGEFFPLPVGKVE